jgi:protein gp37
VPFDFIEDVFATMCEAGQHIFQVLTKRSHRLAEVARDLPWPDNVWAGVTVEHQDYINRIQDLLTVPASVRFLSLEPLLGPLRELPLSGVQWVIVGGESGPGARPMDRRWVRPIRAQCLAQRVPFFFKQWGGFHRKEAGRRLDGHTWNQMPRQAAQSQRRASSVA